MRPSSCLALLLTVCAPVVVLTGAGATAQTSPPSTTSAAVPTASPAPGASTAAPVVLRDADTDRTVHLVPGGQLRVELSPGAAVWTGLERTSAALQLVRYDAGADGLAAAFTALSPGGPEVLDAQAGDRSFRVTVQVGDGATRAPASCLATPAPSATATASALPSATAAPNGRALDATDDGGTYEVRADDPVFVRLDSCGAPYGPVTVEGPLRRVSAFSSVPDGTADAYLVPSGAGRATLRAVRDVPCASRPGAVCPTPWTAVVDVQPPPCVLALLGPGSVPTGTAAALTGRAEPGEKVTVLFRRRGESVFTVRRRLVAGADGAFSTSFLAVDDHRWYATGSRCSSAPGLTQVAPSVTGPARVPRGTTVRLVARAAAGSRVEVLFRRAGTTTSRLGRTGTADAAGRFVTTFRPDVDHAYTARSLGRRSAPGLTQAR